MQSAKTRPLAVLRAARVSELGTRKQRLAFVLWNGLAFLLSSALLCALCLSFAVGVYDWQVFFGYFRHPLIFLLNWLPMLLVQLLLYAACNRQWPAFLLSAAFFLTASIGNFFKWKLRNEPFTFQDISSIGAGLKVAGNYEVGLNTRIVAALICVAAGVVVLALLARGRMGKGLRLISALLPLLCVYPLWRGVYADEALYFRTSNSNLVIETWDAKQYFLADGFVYPFLHSITDSSDLPPEGYDPQAAQALLERYQDEDIPADRRVNIMVLQLESFTDLEAMGFSGVDPETYSVLHRLQEESISGTLVANVIGGGTVFTERAVLAGIYGSLEFRKDCASYVRYFNSQGYFTTGSHPNNSDYYSRRQVMSRLGFREFLFADGYFGDLTGGEWNCDAVYLPEIFRLFRQETGTGKQVFAFHISLQGHGPYPNASEQYTRRLWQGEASPETSCVLNNYLGSVEETQTLLWQELEQLRGLPEPAVLLIYGDHDPYFSNAPAYTDCGVDFDLSTEEGFLRYYGTPYMIWANDAARELLGSDFTGEGPTVSPGYLMNLLFDALGWPGSGYLQYVGSVMEKLPLVSTNGAYIEDGVFSGSLSPEGEKLLQEYRSVQYYRHKLPVDEP